MKIIDTHQHFWKYDPFVYDWITEDMSVIRKDFLPIDLAEVLKAEKIETCISVQANQTEAETEWLVKMADENDFIAGVVGWVDLRSNLIEEWLQYFKQYKKLKGFRHVLQGEEPSFMLLESFLHGISKLNEYGYTYDILIFPHHLEAALQLVKKFPDQRFIIDHIAKPSIKDGKIDEWKADMKTISKQQNVYCKLSGMVTEADWKNWSKENLTPYIDTVVNCFGTDRIMFGSDWPVCLVASSYEKWLNVIKEYFASYTMEEQEKVFSKNAIRFYNL
ncbi:MAG: amidohydrolase family protein [Chitinophagaceae bacterium]|nr:amidohydrolase family protein [Chitinophagaceae bacterium]